MTPAAQRPPSEADVPIAPAMRRGLRALTLAGALMSLAVGLFATVAWWVLGDPSVARLGLAGTAPVRPLSALIVIPAGLALLLLWHADARGRRAPAPAVRVLAGLMFLLALIGLLDVTVASLELDPTDALIDLHGYPDALPRGVAAILLLSAGALVLTVGRDRAGRLVAQASALVVMAAGLLLMLDFALAAVFGAVPQAFSPFAPVVLILFGAGLAAYRPAGGPIAVVASSLPSGALARRIGLAVLVLEPLIAVAAYGLHHRGTLDAEEAFAGVAAATLALVVGATAIFAGRLGPAEAARAAAEEEHRRTAERLRDLYDQAPTGYCSVDGDGVVREINVRLCEWLGSSRDDLLGTAFTDLLTADGVGPFQRALGLLRTGRAVPGLDLELAAAGGAPRPVAFAATPVVGADGALRVARVTVLDVADRRRAEEERAIAERRYRTIVETAAEGLVLVGADGLVTFANAQAEGMLDLPPGGLVGLEFAALGAGDTRERLLARTPRRLAGDLGEIREDLELVRADGSTITVASVFTAIPDDSGAWTGSLGMLTDVTVLRQVERERRRADERYRMIVETASEGVWLVDAAGRTSFVNARMGELLGLEPEEVMACPLADFLHPDDRPDRAVPGVDGRPQFDLRFRHRDGHEVSTLVSSTRLREEDGSPAGALLMVTDMTARLAAERARRDADERARRIVESAQEGIAIIDVGGSITFANERLAQMFGLPPDEVVGIDLRERLEEGGRTVVEERIARREDGEPEAAQFDFRFRRADGTDLWTIVSLTPMFDAEDRWSGSLAMLTDITERRRAETERRMADARYRQIVETAREGIGTMDEQGRITFVNGRVAEMLGRPRHELVGRPLAELLVDDDRDRLLQAVDDARDGREADEGDLQFLRPDGRTVWVRAAVTAMRDPEGAFIGFLGMLDDITERKAAEQALVASERRLQAIIDASPALVAVVDLDLRVVLANRALLALVGAEEGDLLGRPLGQGMTDDARHVVQGLAARARDERRLVQEEHSFRGAARESTWIASAFPLLDDAGLMYALAALATDVTDLKSAEREVRALNRDLEARVTSRTRELEMANRDLATFSYTVAHDLRAPLRTIHGFSSILLEEHGDGLSGDALRYLQLVEQGATEMAQLIEDLLTFARTGQGDVERRTVATEDVVRDALHDLSGDEPFEPEDVRIAPDLPSCYADPRLLRVVFQNLLGNALKFTRGVEARRVEVGAEDLDGETAFFVRDNGAGFPADRSDRLFQMFQRLHSSDQFEGTGLGLAIVERIVHRHGGRAWAEGAVGEGATLRFTLGSEDAVRRG